MKEEYFFIYKNSQNQWAYATNIKFVASHTSCRAIEKSLILENYSGIYEFLAKANNYFIDEETEKFIKKCDLREINY